MLLLPKLTTHVPEYQPPGHLKELVQSHMPCRHSGLVCIQAWGQALLSHPMVGLANPLKELRVCVHSGNKQVPSSLLPRHWCSTEEGVAREGRGYLIPTLLLHVAPLEACCCVTCG